ncbi:MAG: HEAT repeat domain-containing protein [Deltaproteobacteria bacterium]|nr:HEAT repeat domain-containing protein [Deltaproteobacteria bacterium]
MPQILFAGLEAGPLFDGDQRELLPELHVEGDPEQAWDRTAVRILLKDRDGAVLTQVHGWHGPLDEGQISQLRWSEVAGGVGDLARGTVHVSFSRDETLLLPVAVVGQAPIGPSLATLVLGEPRTDGWVPWSLWLEGALPPRGRYSILRADLHLHLSEGEVTLPVASLVEPHLGQLQHLSGILERAPEGPLSAELALEWRVWSHVEQEVSVQVEGASPPRRHAAEESGDHLAAAPTPYSDVQEALVPYDDDDDDDDDELPVTPRAAIPTEDDPWAAALRGVFPPEGLTLTRLLGRARKAVASPDEQERLEAVAIAAQAGDKAVEEILPLFQGDGSAKVRDASFEAALAAGAPGVPTVRRGTASPDPAIAVRSLTLLTKLKDRTVTSRVRGMTGSGHPMIRAAAARYLGHVAGRAVLPQLQRLQQDPDPGVRQAATEALAVLQGSLPELQPIGWWEPGGDAPLPSLPAPEDQPTAPRAPQRASAIPRAPTPGQPAVDLVSLLSQLGAAPTPARAAQLSHLRAVDPAALALAIRQAKVGDPREYVRGAILAVECLELDALVSAVRPLLRHRDAEVRVAAVACLGSRGSAGMLPALSPLLSDEEEAVQAAAMLAMAQLGARFGRERMVEQWLAQTNGSTPALKEALEQARATLAGS